MRIASISSLALRISHRALADRLLLYSDGVESLIGHLHDKDGFRYTDEFLAMQDGSINEIVDRLTDMATSRQVTPAEIDDMAVIRLELA